MKFIKKDHQPLIIIFFVIALLLILSYSQVEYSFDSINIKQIDILSQIRLNKKELARHHNISHSNIPPPIDQSNVPASAVPNNVPQPANQNIVSVSATQNNINHIDSNQLVKIEDFGTNCNCNMTKFFSSLQNECQSKKIRIAYFGDSLIEGDLLSEKLRDNLQNIFGGRGVGFVPITSNVARFRSTIRHSYSNNWQTLTHVSENGYKPPMGMSGYLFIPRKAKITLDQSDKINSYSWVEYSALNNHDEKLNSFKVIRLIYGDVKSTAQVTYRLDNNEYVTRPLIPGEGIREFLIEADKKRVQKMKMIFCSPNYVAVYGTYFEDGPGIYVDNYSLRGSSGINLGATPDSIYQVFNSLLDYRLIILQYGANIADHRRESYSWYENNLSSILLRLKKQFPNAGILVVSAADKSINIGMEYNTNPAIPKIVNAQRNAAKKAEVAFWNLFDAMGGKNSMSVWTKQGLAAKDYTHFSNAGAKKVANLFTEALLYEFNNYKSIAKQ